VIKEIKVIKVHLARQEIKVIKDLLVLQGIRETRVQQVNGGLGVHLEIKVLLGNQAHQEKKEELEIQDKKVRKAHKAHKVNQEIKG
jgi:hypothetical protein